MPVLPTTAELAERYRISDGKKFHLKNMDPADPWGKKLKKIADQMMKQGCKRLAKLQERLYAHDRWSVLIIFQAMDAAGKDSTIKNVMSGVNPQGCEVHSFKAPSTEELDHDLLWRTNRFLPRRGHIGIFNRSYYEETLVVRVHKSILARQQLPRDLITPKIWAERFEDINGFERYLSRQGVLVRKFFLHVSKEEQRMRFLKRLNEPDKNWKFSPADVKEREHFDDYMKAYDDTIRHTATPWAPWHVIPADRKWLMRLLVSAAIIDAIESIDPRYPEVDPEVRAEFARLKEELEKEAEQAKEGKEPKEEPSPKEQKKPKAEKVEKVEKVENAEKAEQEKPA
jgi:PPK2 family polyphosphate:nucleotide phosphotransferase